MILLDANALIAYLGNDPAQPDVRRLLEEGEAAVTTVNLAETVDVLARRFGVEPARTRSLLDPLIDGPLALLPVEARHAWRAGEVRAEHYCRRAAPLSLADCVLLAAAEELCSLATSDAVVATVARTLAIDVLALPGSHGRRPA